MNRVKRDRFRGIASYVHASHAILALAALLGPIAAMSLQPSAHIGPAIGVGALACVVALGGAIAVAIDFAPWHRLTRPFAAPRRRMLLDVVVTLAALAILLLLPAVNGGVSIAAIPMAWALRAIAGGSFWSGIARMFVVAVACGLVAGITALATGLVWEPLSLVVALLFAFGVLGQDSIYSLAIELDDLRALEADRAVATERKRLAGDLHDIQGQHLSLITVEAELVTRLIAAGDTSGATTHARRLQGIAAEALDELHRVVQDTRAVSLEQEVTNAARVLQAAGITVTLDMVDIGPLPEAADRLLGLTVREAITNILKHSRTRDCTIRVAFDTRTGIEGVALSVTDSGPSALHTVRASGTGLTMLRERCREAGGDFAFVAGSGAKLTAWLPISEGGSR
ncbi:sensor histidine kinase [Propioniciclava soli]|uniref:sensor histidine kinase n=1 Tax=Propioniciclava soli TaxID=2775081 RepID=UPI001E4787A5|nr:histidine kinase [Propioniciclava soli]